MEILATFTCTRSAAALINSVRDTSIVDISASVGSSNASVISMFPLTSSTWSFNEIGVTYPLFSQFTLEYTNDT